jgi:hypothetical protein
MPLVSTSWCKVQVVTQLLVEGRGTTNGHDISQTIAAQGFGAGVADVGLVAALLRYLGAVPGAPAAPAISFSWGLALPSGSGSGPVLMSAQAVLVPLSVCPVTAMLGGPKASDGPDGARG